jgi:hypothetical protein
VSGDQVYDGPSYYLVVHKFLSLPSQAGREGLTFRCERLAALMDPALSSTGRFGPSLKLLVENHVHSPGRIPTQL